MSLYLLSAIIVTFVLCMLSGYEIREYYQENRKELIIIHLLLLVIYLHNFYIIFTRIL